MRSTRVLYLGQSEPTDALSDVVGQLTDDGSTVIEHVARVDIPADTLTDPLPDCVIVEPPVGEDLITGVAWFREQEPRLPIILVADPGDVDVIGELLALGADYVPKTAEADYELLAVRLENRRSEFARHGTDLGRQVTATLSELYTVTNQSELSISEKLTRVLTVGADTLDYPFGYASQIENNVMELLAVAGEHEGLSVGRTSRLSDQYCYLVAEEEDPVTISDASTDETLSELPVYTDLGLESYIGAPITVDSELYGSLCYADSESRNPALIESQKPMVKTLAQWVGYEIERSQREQELQRQIDRLEEFTSIVSHDLRNPLNVAQLQLGLARETCESSHLPPVADALDRMEEIIEDTLVLARQGQTVDEMHPIELVEIVADCWSVVDNDTAELQIVDEFTIHGDSNRMRHIFENLFANAIEHSEGSVTIRVGLCDVMHTSTRAPTSGTFCFYVEDDGSGIPEARRESVFEVGETTREDGTGFGLSIVKQIAEAHEWDVTLTESFDGGARFEFRNVR